jgi:Leu/Phe-tRNA-protein transferase
MLLGALILGADWHATSLVGGLFALCFRTAFRGFTAYSRE